MNSPMEGTGDPIAPGNSHRGVSQRVKRAAALSAVSLALAGGALAMAPTASAVDSSGCNSLTYDHPAKITSSAVNLRSGPGTSYSAEGVLYKGTRTYVYCYKDYGTHGLVWDYVKVTSGPDKGVKGWVSGDLELWL